MKNRNEQDNLNVLRAVHKSPKNSQRELADKLGFSLGKINYCLKALKEKGFIKIKNFQNQKSKINYIQYVLTPKGISLRTQLALNFMKRKMKEYEELKNELEKNK
jgi:EPS-associated MarR family transcriptional regulator|tara:strand:- start:794 stop:1108 length:315 start_codon:yes stop_codon:yes gene_type:complete